MAIALAPRTLPSAPARQVAPAAGLIRAGLFVAIAAAYAFVGAHLVVGLDAPPDEAVTRLARAYLVWHGADPKLAAIGFASPPLGTLALVPLTAVGGLATSLTALPVFGGLCGGVTVLALDRSLARCGMNPVLRAPLVAAFALNPIVAFQFTTGTSAALELALLAVALRGLVGWGAGADPRALLGAGVGFAGLVLTRYEFAAWAVVAGLLIVESLTVNDAEADEVEGTATAFWAPGVATLALWTLLGALIVSSAFGWMRHAWSDEAAAGLNAADAAHKAGELVLQAYPLAFLTVGALLGLRAARRDAVAGGLAALVAVGALVAAVHAYAADATGPLMLETGPALLLAALVGAGWAHRDGGRRRAALWWATLALLVAGGGAAWHALSNYPYQDGERQWAEALRTNADQGTTTEAQNIARAVRRAAPGHARVLADEDGTGAAILLSRVPKAYLTRSGAGAERWDAALRAPGGRVDYLLAARGDAVDRGRPGLLDGRDRSALVVATAGPYVLARVVGP